MLKLKMRTVAAAKKRGRAEGDRNAGHNQHENDQATQLLYPLRVFFTFQIRHGTHSTYEFLLQKMMCRGENSFQDKNGRAGLGLVDRDFWSQQAIFAPLCSLRFCLASHRLLRSHPTCSFLRSKDDSGANHANELVVSGKRDGGMRHHFEVSFVLPYTSFRL
jgi:hypothetical protein